MSIDKNWTRPALNRNSPEFKRGLNDFYERCKAHINDRGLCFCPCRLCGNRDKLTPLTIKHHIHNNGFSRGYPTWVHHGEPSIIPPPIVDDRNDMINVLNDVRRENNYIQPEPKGVNHTPLADTRSGRPMVYLVLVVKDSISSSSQG
ncbi:ribonuclease H-like domain-containing protein [Tanacetum coccineum]